MRRNRLFPYVLLTPALTFIAVVTLYPSLYSLFLSLNTFKRGAMIFVGLQNFEQIFGSNDFYQSLGLTAFYGLAFVSLTMMFGFVVALIFNSGIRFGGSYMTIVFIPWMLSEIVSGVIFRWLFLPQFGILQNLLGPWLGDIRFLGDPGGALGVVIGATVWRSLAFAMLLILAGLQTIPGEVHEAAAMDGANRWQGFWLITWPLTRPTTQVTTLLLTLQAVNSVGLFWSITQGGPGRATEVLSLFMYRESILFFNFGYGAALSVIMLALNVMLATLYVRLMRSEQALE